jgi:hypothetical protein
MSLRVKLEALTAFLKATGGVGGQRRMASWLDWSRRRGHDH